jgi:opacity protein-like surface antigen
MRQWVSVLALALLAALATPQSSTAGDAFFKGGLLFHPDVGGIGDRWFLSVGSDWGVAPMGFLGVEFQSAYHSEGVSGLASVKSVPANFFFNGKWKSEAEALRPYAGAGIGLVSAIVRTEFLGITDTTYERSTGFQLMAGVEFNRKFLFELVGQRAFTDGAQFGWSIAGGFRW